MIEQADAATKDSPGSRTSFNVSFWNSLIASSSTNFLEDDYGPRSGPGPEMPPAIPQDLESVALRRTIPASH